MDARLIPIAGTLDQEEVVLSSSKPVVIGRGESADILVAQSKVSRTHCRISFDNGFYVIEDLDSKNGTWVNNRRVSKAFLFHHDQIHLGDADFRFVLEEALSESSGPLLMNDETQFEFDVEFRDKSPAKTANSMFLSLPKGDSSVETSVVKRNLSAVMKVIEKVNAEPNLDRLLEDLMDDVMEVTDADRGYLIASRKVGDVLIPMVSRHKESVPPSARNTFSRNLVSEAYETGHAMLLSDPMTKKGMPDSVLSQPVHSIMCVPMRARIGQVGVIYVDRLLGSLPFEKSDLKLFTTIANQAGIAVRRAQLTRQVESLFRDAVRTVINLVEIKDKYTYSHSERVTAVALLVGDLMSFSKKDQRDLEVAALLHDVGKLGVDPDILTKPRTLTDDEFARVKRHTVDGARVVADIENGEQIAEAVRHHHERWDGTGYPDGCAAEEASLFSRILALADSFDAMASDRPYRKALTREETISELKKCKGTQFDPALVNVFTDALENERRFRNRIAEIYRREDKEKSPA
ncbi:MAG: HD domain-containing protein [Planctomycetes bacterium]|nr:HD domain-containing protein [Planctomycetota bacterium]